jgi:hypothetical protein
MEFASGRQLAFISASPAVFEHDGRQTSVLIEEALKIEIHGHLYDCPARAPLSKKTERDGAAADTSHGAELSITEPIKRQEQTDCSGYASTRTRSGDQVKSGLIRRRAGLVAKASHVTAFHIQQPESGSPTARVPQCFTASRRIGGQVTAAPTACTAGGINDYELERRLGGGLVYLKNGEADC